MATSVPNPLYFSSASEWRNWLIKHHAKQTELLVGFYKVASGKPSMTWSESVDEALCFGWIDAVRKSVDHERYTIRFCVRKQGSIWSQINLKKIEQLTAAGKMAPAGLVSFQARDRSQVNRYSFEQTDLRFDPAYQVAFEANKKAWTFYLAQSPSYRRETTWWVMGAKQSATQRKRLAALIELSESGIRKR